jgi:hypothetical protein
MEVELAVEDMREILQNIKRNHDASIGISWVTIQLEIVEYLKEKKG